MWNLRRISLVIAVAVLMLGICTMAVAQAVHTVHPASPVKPLPKAAGKITQITVTASPVTFTGACGQGKTIRFRATITASGPGDFKYTWLRSDGATDNNPHEVKFTAAGNKVVSDEWTLSETTNGWEALKITSPMEKTSAHAVFHLKCAAPKTLNPPGKTLHK